MTRAKNAADWREAFRFFLFLCSSILAAITIVWLHSQGFKVDLGWSKTPGTFVLITVFLLATYAHFRQERKKKTILVFTLYCLPMFMDFMPDLIPSLFPVSPVVWICVSLIPLWIASEMVLRMQSDGVKAAFWCVAVYVQSVFVHNAFHPNQYMGFFGGGWTG
jgi:hypothetical protein